MAADFALEDDIDQEMADNNVMQGQISITVNNDEMSANGQNDSNDANMKKRGRGFEPSIQSIISSTVQGHDSLKTFNDDLANDNVQKSVEGYVLFVSGVHDEAKEDDLFEKFSEFGHVKQINVPLDRRTGFIKGYALIEYATFKEAEAAKNGADQSELYNKILTVDWAFVQPK